MRNRGLFIAIKCTANYSSFVVNFLECHVERLEPMVLLQLPRGRQQVVRYARWRAGPTGAIAMIKETKPTTHTNLMPLHIESRMLTVRGVRIIIDADLAELYGVPNKRFNEQVKRNTARFPSDFVFQLTAAEKAEVVANCDHLARLKFAKALPLKRLDEIEDKAEALVMQHDTFSRNTRAQLKQVFDALRELTTPPDPPKRPIGFVLPKERDSDKDRDSGSKNKKK